MAGKKRCVMPADAWAKGALMRPRPRGGAMVTGPLGRNVVGCWEVATKLIHPRDELAGVLLAVVDSLLPSTKLIHPRDELAGVLLVVADSLLPSALGGMYP